MSQTERTTDAVMALLADNTTGNIDPEDMRDAIATSMGGYASMILNIAGSGAVKSSVSTTPVKITEYNVVTAQSITDNAGGSSADAATGVLTVGTTGCYFVSFFTSFSLDGNNKLVHFQPFINNTVGLVEVTRFIGTGSDTGLVAMNAVVPYSAGDEVDIRVLLNTGTQDVTFEALGFTIFRVG
jgi:hypothetical protein